MAYDKSDLVMTYQFAAPVKRVWKAWTQEEEIKKWWGPEGFTVTHIEFDFRVEGKYFYCMHRVNTHGGKGWDFCSGGIFRDIVEPNPGRAGKIVMIDSFMDKKGNKVPAAHYGKSENFPLETMIVATFKEEDGDTKLTLQYPDVGAINSKDLSNMKESWEQSLRKLGEALK